MSHINACWRWWSSSFIGGVPPSMSGLIFHCLVEQRCCLYLLGLAMRHTSLLLWFCFTCQKKKIALYIFQYKNTSYTYNSSIDFYIAQIVGCPIFFIFHHISCENNFEVGRSKTSGIYWSCIYFLSLILIFKFLNSIIKK